ncbi:MAG TPA: hypothetical protein VFF69_12410 [Phycisphaerales bacterium]|nr:hypothetical protein [Phycisphaerales bacterium]
MTLRRRAILWRSAFWVCLALAAAILVASAATWRYNTWLAGHWPRYAGVHRGGLVLLSTIWDRPPDAEWGYDAFNVHTRWPPVRHIGNAYSLTAVRWSARIWVVEIPLWLLALIPAAAAVPIRRRARRHLRALRNQCPSCGYPRPSLTGPCPECGRTPGA